MLKSSHRLTTAAYDETVSVVKGGNVKKEQIEETLKRFVQIKALS